MSINDGKPSGLQHTHFVEERQERYLAVLQATGEPILARKEVGVHRDTVRQRRHKDDAFRHAEEEALRVYRAGLATEVHRRGYLGVEEPIYYKGEVVGVVLKYSDRLAELHIKRHCPAYRDKLQVDQKTELQGAVTISDIRKLSRESRDDLRRILEREMKSADSNGE